MIIQIEHYKGSNIVLDIHVVKLSELKTCTNVLEKDRYLLFHQNHYNLLDWDTNRLLLQKSNRVLCSSCL